MSTGEDPGRLLLDCHLDAGVAVVTVTGDVSVPARGLSAAPSSGS